MQGLGLQINMIDKIKLMEKILSRSKLTEEDALIIGRKVNKEIARRHGLYKKDK